MAHRRPGVANRRPGAAGRRPGIPPTGGMDVPSGPERRVLTVGLLFLGPECALLEPKSATFPGPKKSAALFFRRRICAESHADSGASGEPTFAETAQNFKPIA